MSKFTKGFKEIARPSFLVIIVGLFAVAVGFIELFSAELIKIEKEESTNSAIMKEETIDINTIKPTNMKAETVKLTTHGKRAIVAFVVGIVCFLVAMWYENFLSGREIVDASCKIDDHHNEMATRFDFTSKKVEDHYDEVAKKFMIYPSFKESIKMHFEHLEDIYSCVTKYYQPEPRLTDLSKRYLQFWFNHFIDPDLSKCRNQLQNFELVLETERINLLQDFIGLFWESVKPNGTISATSIVNPPPGGFWENRQAYLEMQKLLHEKKGVFIYRYFIFVDDYKNRLERYKDTLKDNIQKGIKTRVTLFRDKQQAGECYQDTGLVDDLMTLEHVLENGEIKKISCFICVQENPRIQKKQRIFTELENHDYTLKAEDSGNDIAKFTEAVGNKIKELTGS